MEEVAVWLVSQLENMIMKVIVTLEEFVTKSPRHLLVAQQPAAQ
jgi:hypothetical protein